MYDYGVEFVGEANAFCFDYAGSTCDTNTSWGGDPGATARNTERAGMLFLGAPSMNRAAGFTTGFSFYYSNPSSNSSAFQVWSGLNGTGSLLASLSLGQTNDGVNDAACFFDNYCSLVAASVAFAGTAQSVVFTGGANGIAYDDITFGSVIPGVVTPEPATFAMLGIGMLAVGVAARRRRVRQG